MSKVILSMAGGSWAIFKMLDLLGQLGGAW